MPTPTTLVKIIEQSGLDKSKSDYLLEKFADYTAIAAEWEKKAKEIVVTDESQKDLMQQASEGRKLLKTKRVEIEKTRKELKEQSLNEGRAIDGIAKALTAFIEPTEKYLDEQEKFAERAKAKRERELHIERFELIKPYVDVATLSTTFFGDMPQSQFDALHIGYKATYENKIAAEKKVEEDRIEKEEQDKKDREAQRIENERLKKEAEEKNKIRNVRNAELRPYIIFIRDYNAMLDMDEETYQKELSEIKIGAEEHWEAEREKQRQQAIADDLRREEFAKKQAEAIQLQAELDRTKADEEKKRLEQEKLESAPDKEKIKDLIIRLTNFDLPEVKSKKAKQIIAAAQIKLMELIDNVIVASSKL